MKKISLLIVLVLALALTLTLMAACNQAETTNAIPRWSDGEYVFSIHKADFNAKHDGYALQPIISNYEWNPEGMDQIIPDNIGGSYVFKISTVGENQKLETTQVLYCQYGDSLKQESIWSSLEQFVPAADDINNPFAETAGKVVLKSVTKTSVEFDSAQRPLNSSNEINGFYLGKIQKEVSIHSYSTVYDWENNRAKVVIDGGEEISKKLKVNSSRDFIDANQVLLYMRSLEKSQTSFQDSPTVQIFMPLSQEIVTGNFYFMYDCKTAINIGKDDITAVSLNGVSVAIKNSVLLTQYNLPDSVNKDGAHLDNSSFGGVYRNKYTTVRFRSGAIGYELQTITEGGNTRNIYSEEIVNAIKLAAPQQ